MPEIRIAVATSDGSNVDRHFGRTGTFTVYGLTEEASVALETRKTTAPCGGGFHNDDLLDAVIEVIGDCRAVVAAAIGPGAIDALLEKRILPVVLEGPVDEALQMIRNSKFLVL